MAESLIGKRLYLAKGKQRLLFERIEQQLSYKEMARCCRLSERTLYGWRNEKFLADAYCIFRLCQKSGVPFPKCAKFKERYWYTVVGAQKGGKSTYEKYGRIGGSEAYRKAQWQKWWDREGKVSMDWIGKKKGIQRPRYSSALAEFTGILLGDGGISNYQVTVTLHRIDDKMYGQFFRSLVKKLFNIPVGIYEDKRSLATNYVLSRKELVGFCEERLGLVVGNKIIHQVDVPDWIMQQPKYYTACIRGLIDTDGSVYTHRYCVSGKNYIYKKIDFTSRSKSLRCSLARMLRALDIVANIRGDHVAIDDQKAVKRFFAIVGSHNPKHLKRYDE